MRYRKAESRRASQHLPRGGLTVSADQRRRERTTACYSWTELYQAAVLETDENKLPSILLAAKAAIDDPLHELQLGNGEYPLSDRPLAMHSLGQLYYVDW